MTDKTPKLLVDALGAIDSAMEFVAGVSFPDGQDRTSACCIGRESEIGDRFALRP